MEVFNYELESVDLSFQERIALVGFRGWNLGGEGICLGDSVGSGGGGESRSERRLVC